VHAEPMREDRDYLGARVRLTATIAGARLSLQIDIGFGDAVTPAPEEITYPTLLPFPPPQIRAYPKETVVAEKYEALVSLGMTNSRMKDFYDLWVMSSLFPFEGASLAAATAATFSRRQTALPAEAPLALTAAFAEDAQKQAQWAGFVGRTNPSITPPALPAVIDKLRLFLLPVSATLQKGQAFTGEWIPNDSWR
jgi:Nucleotidyl transferase AbiEii toxin, Type IV TA system